MADDIGYSDFGCYGGEIATPNIDRLANNGMRFTAMHNMAKCNPTRSSLLTGLYTGGEGAVHLGHISREAGYFNIMSGKEHFDEWVPEYCKAEKVFDHSFTFWATTEYFRPPSGEFERPFYLEGRELKADEIQYEKSPMYKTDFITTYALNWLDEAFTTDQPFFLYLPYHAAHYPLQARPEDIEKYRGKYLQGWDKLREDRFLKMKQLGVIPENAVLSMPEGNKNQFRGPFVPEYTDYYPWKELSDEKKDQLDLEMAVYAAMIDRMDQNIGRVLERIEQEGEMDNTIILFLVDNGACPFYSNKIPDIPPGPDSSYWSLRSSWANLCNTPYRQYKQTGYKGGSLTPFIVSWPGVTKPGTISHEPSHVVDILPTFLEILKVQYPDSIMGIKTLAFHGISLLSVLTGEGREDPEFLISGLENFRSYTEGNFKIVKMNGGDWKLYNLQDDPSETKDLSLENPDMVKQMARNYGSLQWEDRGD